MVILDGLEPFLSPLGPILGRLGGILAGLGAFCGGLGRSWGGLGRSWGDLWVVLWRSWAVRSEPLWAKHRSKIRSTSEMASGGYFELILGGLGVDFGWI